MATNSRIGCKLVTLARSDFSFKLILSLARNYHRLVLDAFAATLCGKTEMQSIRPPAKDVVPYVLQPYPIHFISLFGARVNRSRAFSLRIFFYTKHGINVLDCIALVLSQGNFEKPHFCEARFIVAPIVIVVAENNVLQQSK